MERCWLTKPDDRPSFTQALRDLQVIKDDENVSKFTLISFYVSINNFCIQVFTIHNVHAFFWTAGAGCSKQVGSELTQNSKQNFQELLRKLEMVFLINLA